MIQKSQLEELGSVTAVREALERKEANEEAQIKMAIRAKKLNEGKFLQEYLSLIEEEVFTRIMIINRGKKGQYNVNIPKEYAESIDINQERNKILFKLTIPALNSNKPPKLEGHVIQDEKEIVIEDKKDIIGETERLAKKVLTKGIGIGRIPFNTTELIILKILAQKRKSATTQEIASSANSTWPTTNKYLEILKDKGMVVITESGAKKRTKWAFNRKYFEKLEKMALGL